MKENIKEIGEVVGNVDKTSRIAIVASIIWLIVIGVSNNDFRGFDGETFLIVGVLPVVAYWGFRFIKSAKT